MWRRLFTFSSNQIGVNHRNAIIIEAMQRKAKKKHNLASTSLHAIRASGCGHIYHPDKSIRVYIHFGHRAFSGRNAASYSHEKHCALIAITIRISLINLFDAPNTLALQKSLEYFGRRRFCGVEIEHRFALCRGRAGGWKHSNELNNYTAQHLANVRAKRK